MVFGCTPLVADLSTFWRNSRASSPAMTTLHQLYRYSPANDDHISWQHIHLSYFEPIFAMITTVMAPPGHLARFRRGDECWRFQPPHSTSIGPEAVPSNKKAGTMCVLNAYKIP